MTVSLTPSSAIPQEPASHAPSGTPRWVWALMMLLAAVLIGGTGGLLAYAGGASVPNAVLTGGGAFATAIGIQLALALFLAGRN